MYTPKPIDSAKAAVTKALAMRRKENVKRLTSLDPLPKLRHEIRAGLRIGTRIPICPEQGIQSFARRCRASESISLPRYLQPALAGSFPFPRRSKCLQNPLPGPE